MNMMTEALAWDIARAHGTAYGSVMADIEKATKGDVVAMNKYGMFVTWKAISEELIAQGLDPLKAVEQDRITATLIVIIKQNGRQVRAVPPKF